MEKTPYNTASLRDNYMQINQAYKLTRKMNTGTVKDDIHVSANLLLFTIHSIDAPHDCN